MICLPTMQLFPSIGVARARRKTAFFKILFDNKGDCCAHFSSHKIWYQLSPCRELPLRAGNVRRFFPLNLSPAGLAAPAIDTQRRPCGAGGVMSLGPRCDLHGSICPGIGLGNLIC